MASRQFEKFAESYWDWLKRQYGYAAPSWMGGSKRPDFSNRAKFKQTWETPGREAEAAIKLERGRRRTRIGTNLVPKEVREKRTKEYETRQVGLKQKAWERVKKDEVSKRIAKMRKAGTLITPSAATSTTSTAPRKPTVYEKFMRQDIPLKDQPKQSLVGIPPESQPPPPKKGQPPGGVSIKMRSGKGYNWLAGQLSKQLPAPVTASSLRKRMGGRMLYRDKKYSFDPAALSGGGSLTGGQSSKEIERAVRSGKAWRGGGREKFLAKREAGKASQQVAKTEATAKVLGEYAKRIRSAKPRPEAPKVEQKRPSRGVVSKGSKEDVSDFLVAQERVRRLQRLQGQPFIDRRAMVTR